MTDAPNAVPYQPRRRFHPWPDIAAAIVILMIPVLIAASFWAGSSISSDFEFILGFSFFLGMLIPWLPPSWSWFRLAPAAARVVHRDFRQDMAMTLRTPAEVLWGEVGVRALWSTLPTLALMLVVVLAGLGILTIESGRETWMIIGIGGFCFVVSTPVLLLVGWSLLSWLARRRLAAGDGGWLSWSLIQLIVALVFHIIAAYVLEGAVLMLLVPVASFLDAGSGGGILSTLGVVAVLAALTAALVIGFGLVLKANLTALARGLWVFDGDGARLAGGAVDADESAPPPPSPVAVRRARLALILLELPVVAFYCVGLGAILFWSAGVMYDPFIVFSDVWIAVVVLLAMGNGRVALTGVRLVEPSLSAGRAMARVVGHSLAFVLPLIVMVGAPVALPLLGWSLVEEYRRSFDPYHQWDSVAASLITALWVIMVATTVVLHDSARSLRRPPRWPSPMAIAGRLAGYPALMLVAGLFFVAVLLMPTTGFLFWGGASGETLTHTITIATWGSVMNLATLTAMAHAIIVWRRAWNDRWEMRPPAPATP